MGTSTNPRPDRPGWDPLDRHTQLLRKEEILPRQIIPETKNILSRLHWSGRGMEWARSSIPGRITAVIPKCTERQASMPIKRCGHKRTYKKWTQNRHSSRICFDRLSNTGVRLPARTTKNLLAAGTRQCSPTHHFPN